LKKKKYNFLGILNYFWRLIYLGRQALPCPANQLVKNQLRQLQVGWMSHPRMRRACQFDPRVSNQKEIKEK
jgi:hypothetical protein